ncbi:ADP-ribosylation factor GTPase-activating protein AGD3 [Dendrobium catenatum]|uniref:ADP-ribosylation factor GTPase-activating protein AGD3 n=1 Tax=Dendrobium catenatum TaxID=906689 RepID=A0A2I0WN61_9ASPA|nr:ADP-ribosylation factor GTPase-activating protein AGD3 [Dendrobium catenatum]
MILFIRFYRTLLSIFGILLLPLTKTNLSSGHHRTASESSSFDSSTDLDHVAIEESSFERNSATGASERFHRISQQHRFNIKHEKPIDLLRKVCGNDICADCYGRNNKYY